MYKKEDQKLYEEIENSLPKENTLPSAIPIKKISEPISSNFGIDFWHYLCPLCHTFPKLILKENKKVCISCKEIKDVEMELNDYMKYRITNHNINEYASSAPNNKYIGYCFDCKINFSNNHSNEHKTHFTKLFKDMLNFIRNKLKIPDNNDEILKTEELISSTQTSKSGNTNIYENDKDNKMRLINKEQKNTIDNLYPNNSIGNLISIIIQDFELYPNYSHYENIKNIFYYLSDQMEIEYHNFENGSLDIRIFGENFVKNNANNFVFFIDGKEEKLKEKITVKGPNETLKIKLIKINETNDLSEMFNKCDCLSRIIINNNKWDTSNVTTMSGMFYGCKALEFLPDISKWKTNKITDLSSMFEGCETLESFSNISNWNVDNVKNMSNMFCGCESLEHLPDFSEWSTNNLENIDSIFQNCKNLNSLEGLEKWDMSKVINMSYVFKDCLSITKLKDISIWNTKKVTSFSYMFADCKSLTSLPDLSKWNTQNVKKMNYMFSNCIKLTSLPNISTWNVKNVISMSNMLENCSSLKSIPDISKWQKNKDLDTSSMFIGCDSLKEIPNLNN